MIGIGRLETIGKSMTEGDKLLAVIQKHKREMP